MITTPPNSKNQFHTTAQDLMSGAALNDYPFKGQVDYMFGTLFASKYDAALHEVWVSVNANEPGLLANIRKEDVETIINVYVNLIKSNKLYHVFDEEITSLQKEELLNKVATDSGFQPGLVEKILKNLLYATNDGRIVNDDILRPRKGKVLAQIRNTPSDVDSYKNKMFDLGDSGKYLLWGGAAAVALVGLFYVSNIASSAKTIIKG